MTILKKLAFLGLSFVLFFAFTAAPAEAYVGKWKGEDKGDIGYLTLSTDGYATFEFNGQIMGGKSYQHQSVNASMTYEVDMSSNPYDIDFVIINNENDSEIGRLEGILKMVNSNKMRLALGFDGSSRPSYFSDDDSIYFIRDK